MDNSSRLIQLKLKMMVIQTQLTDDYTFSEINKIRYEDAVCGEGEIKTDNPYSFGKTSSFK